MAVALCAMGLVPMTNFIPVGVPLKWWSSAVHHWLGWAVIIGCAAIILPRLLPRTCAELAARIERLLLRPTPRTFALLLGVATCLLTLFFGWRLFHWQPVTIDELAQEWQARLLTMGRVAARGEPHAEFFSTMQTVQVDGRWFGQFPIGGPALVSIGMLFGAPWLINPLLAGCAAIAVYRFAAATSSEAQARGVAVLFALSPFVLFIAGSELHHAGTLAAIWMSLAALPVWLASETDADARRPAALIGAGVGIAATIRPYDAAIVALVIGLFQLRHAGRRWWLYRSLLVQAFVGAAPVMALLAVNSATTGHPFTFGYDVLHGPEHRPGFHMSPLGFEHTPRHGLYAISSYLMRLNITLLAWPIPALLLVVATLAWQRRATRWDHLLLAMLGAVLIGYFWYWGIGSFVGPRFLYVAAPVFLIYIARLPGVLLDRIHRPALRAAVVLLIPLWLLTAWLSPPSTTQPFGIWTLSETTQQRDSVANLITTAVRQRHLENAVVFVPDGWHARLAARLRKLGARPFMAQLIVRNVDACNLQRLLDRVETTPSLAGRQTDYVFAMLDRERPARAVPGLRAHEQLALAKGRPLPPECRQEFERLRSNGVDLARLLPDEELDSLGRLGGKVVYARDFGERNALLRDRFGDRDWYAARVERRDDTLAVTLERLPPASAPPRMASSSPPSPRR
jgi:hypothetical protein